MFPLYLNFLLFLLSTLYSYKKNGFAIITFLWLYHCIYALLGIIAVDNGVYAEQIEIYNKKISCIPYLINFLCVYLIISPLKNIRKENIAVYCLQNKKIINRIGGIIFLSIIVYLFIRLYELKLVLGMNFEERYRLIAGEGAEILDGNISLQYCRKLCGFIYYSSFPFIMAYTFIGIINKNLNKRQVLISLVLSFLPLLISCVIAANRSELYLLVFRIFFFILIYFQFFSKRIKRLIVTFGILGLSSVLIVVLLISTSRFENSKNTAFDSILRYLGETYPNVGYVYWDNVKKHPMGKKSFPSIYYTFNEGKPVDLDGHFEKHSYWNDYTGVPTLYFKPLFFELYIEFDWIIALIIIYIIHLIAYRGITRKRIYYLEDIAVSYVYFIICCHSIIGNPLSIKTMQVFIGILLLSKLLKFTNRKQLKYLSCKR